jgi:asparagine synthase (glutamine-hydrolysing)
VKRGLAVPLAAWLGGPLLPFVRETLARLDPSVFRREAVQELLDEHVDRRRDNRRELWALLVLQLWVDRNAATWHGHTATRVAMTHAVDLSVAN